MLYPLRRRLLWMAACVLTVETLWGTVSIAQADGFNQDLLKTGMTLSDVVQAFGQPNRMEWVNQKDTPVLFLFYPTEDRFSLLRLFGNDLVTLEDGHTYTPLGFVTEVLAGWGKKFYDQARFPQQ
ncbi:MAG TPA: hypothetical protein VE201_10055 [Nitrospirales bacterium]|nr:hypothetical protein [Nitrospirales bacterium]